MFLIASKNRHTQLATRNSARGFTLIEMLISMAVTLIMMAAVVTLFANIGAGVRNRNAGIELGGQIRIARAQLFRDLAGATSPARPKLPSDDHDDGYLEIIEGQWSDKHPSLLTDGATVTASNPELDFTKSIIPGSNLSPEDGTDALGLGDYDDILALTVHSDNEPFKGRADGAAIEANDAEIIWYCVENPVDGSLGEPGMRTVYRRVLLIAPWVDVSAITPVGTDNAQKLKNFYDLNDISVRLESNRFVPNTLSDLTKRENRFAHLGGFPFHMNVSHIRFVNSSANPLAPFTGDRISEDVMLNDVLAFDLRVLDNNAPSVLGADGEPLEPSDRGWYNPTAMSEIVGMGAFVDLGWEPGYPLVAIENEVLASPLAKRRLAGPMSPSATIYGYPCVYDTWPYSYENDGLNQNGGSLVDEGTDGLDNDGLNGVDDVSERETAPPYDVALRAMQVKIRIYDRDTRQIREATVTRNFVPQ